MAQPAKKLGLTLGGGGAKGFAHIGVYKILYDNKIPIHCISGASMGAVIAAGIAQGRTPTDLLNLMEEFAQKKTKLIRLNRLGLREGAVLDGKEEYEILKKLIPENLTFEQLNIPLKVNAVDLEKGEEIIFDSGNVAQAVLASSALPGVYPPIFYKDRLLVDGGVLNSIPVNLCKTMGANVLVAVDLKSFYSEQNISGMIYHFYIQKKEAKTYHLNFKKNHLHEMMLKLGFPLNVMMRAMAITERKNAEQILADTKPDVIIHPNVAHFSVLDFKNCREIYEAGIEAGEKWLPEIQKII